MTVPYASPIPGGLVDPGVALPISVTRTTGQFIGNGVWQSAGSPETINGRGILYPTTADELRALPEGERVTKSITCYWALPFALGDLIVYGGENYRVVYRDPWTNYGYNRAIAQVVQL